MCLLQYSVFFFYKYVYTTVLSFAIVAVDEINFKVLHDDPPSRGRRVRWPWQRIEVKVCHADRLRGNCCCYDADDVHDNSRLGLQQNIWHCNVDMQCNIVYFQHRKKHITTAMFTNIAL